MLKLGTKLVCVDHPEWGVWIITKVPDKRDDWYYIKGESGERVLHTGELHFWMKA